MTIKFSVNHDDKYVVMKFTGQITDQELFDAYAEYYRRDEWFPSLNQLTDLSQADMTDVTASGLQNLAYHVEQIYRQNIVSLARVATFALDSLPFGLARMYKGMTGKIPRRFRVFRRLKDAEDWLTTMPRNPSVPKDNLLSQ